MTKGKDDENVVDLTQAFRVWAKRNNVRPKDFQRAMRWAGPYAWEVLRGKHKFTQEAHGRFIEAYGISALAEIYRIAKVDPEPKEPEAT